MSTTQHPHIYIVGDCATRSRIMRERGLDYRTAIHTSSVRLAVRFALYQHERHGMDRVEIITKDGPLRAQQRMYGEAA